MYKIYILIIIIFGVKDIRYLELCNIFCFVGKVGKK